MKNLLTFIFLCLAISMSAQTWFVKTGQDSCIYRYGKVGIGLNDPNSILEVNEEIQVRLNNFYPKKNVARIVPLGFSNETGAANWALRGVYQYTNGVSYNSDGGDLDLIKSYNGNTILSTNLNNSMLGKVGIGTITPQYELDVSGTIRANRIIVELDGADFVFEDDYKLISLDSLEKNIKKNKHLPDIQSASQMKKNGVELSDLNTRFLQKIEELTLYIIDTNKRINLLELENKKLRSQLNKLSE